jgi:hypothetical protein
MATHRKGPWFPLLLAVVLVLGIGLFFTITVQPKIAGNPKPPVSSSTPSRNSASAVTFAGTLTADGCVTSSLPVGDVGCSITVDGKYLVYVEHGNVRSDTPWGTMINFPVYPTNPVGQIVQVYAHKLDQNDYTLEGSSSFYVKLP